MTILSIATIGFVIGILGLGLLFVWIFRGEPRRGLNIALLTVGCALLTYAHLQWAGRHESETVKEAMFIRQLVAGWAMVAMGFLGLQCGRNDPPSESP
jgi:4-hydroxybenzoate polyprenyltransferase